LLRRTVRSFFQVIGTTIAGLAVLFGVLVWKLAAGPISLSFLTPYFESALKAPDNSFEIKLEDTILTWFGRDKDFGIKLIGAKAIASDDTVIAKVPELAVSLSGTALLQGKLAPSTISIFGPSLNIIRTELGKLELGIAQSNGSFGSFYSAKQGFAGRIIGELLSPGYEGRPIGYLRKINIVNANVRIDDRQLAVQWIAPDTDLSIVRQDNNVFVSAKLLLKSNDGTIKKSASINLVGDYNLEKKEIKITIGFADLNPTIFSSFSKSLKLAKSFDLPVSGTFDAVILNDGEIDKFEFDLSGGKGRVTLSDPIELSSEIAEIKFVGEFNKRVGRLLIKNFFLDFGREKILKITKPFTRGLMVRKLSFSGNYDYDFKRLIFRKTSTLEKELTVNTSGKIQRIGDEILFEVNSETSDIPIRDIHKFWPHGWEENTKDWIINNLSDGVMTSAKANFSGNYNDQTGLKIASIIGVVNYRDMTVEFNSPIPKVTKSRGQIRFDGKRMDIEIKHGKSDDLSIHGSNITLTGLDGIDQVANVNLRIEGPLVSIFKVIKSKPFNFVESIQSNQVAMSGRISSKVNLNFLIKKEMVAEKIKASFEAELKNVGISQVAFGFDLTQADLVLIGNNEGMKITGSGMLSGVNTKISWRENFGQEGEIRSEYSFKTNIDDKSWREKLGFNFPPFNKNYLSGSMGVNANVKIKKDGTGTLDADIDLEDTLINVSKMGWLKPAKVGAKASILAKFDSKKFTSIPKLSVKGQGIDVDAKASFLNNGELDKLTINRLKFDQTDVKAMIAPQADANSNSWHIHVSGKQLDLVNWLVSEELEVVRIKGNPFVLSLNVDSIQLYPNKWLHKVNGVMSFDGWVWHQMNLRSGLEVDNSLNISLRSEDGKRSLDVSSTNAGLTLKTFDYYDNVIGGKLSLRGKYEGMKPDSKFSGRAQITNFRVIKAPILAKLLNLASVTGIVDELLGGIGIGFTRLNAPFESDNNIITVKDASVSGLSLGMTAAGTINESLETVQLEGTLVPAYVFNTALTRLPIIGKIFSGGEKGGGVFAANYTMLGNIKEPDISTNPLSVLAPGFLRKLFKIFDIPNEKMLEN